MAQQVINVGTGYNTGSGDPLRDALIKVNENFTEIYAKVASLEDGSIVTDIKGNVFSDDSTLLVDAVNGTIPGYISIADLQTLVAASVDFDDFQTRIAAL